jgi:hypothetical protein
MHYSGSQVKSILEHAKTDTASSIDFNKITAVSTFLQSDNALRDWGGSYQLHGIFEGAYKHILYYGAGCLPIENKDFMSSRFKGTTVFKFKKMDALLQQMFRDALADAAHENYALKCIQVCIVGQQEKGVDTNFGEAEKNALVVGN